MKKPEAGRLAVGCWSADLADGWRYAFTYVPESPSLLKGVDLTFQNGADDGASMSAICSLDFNHYDKALRAMGFDAAPTYGPIGQMEDWRYTKLANNGVGGNIVISVIPQNLNDREPTQLCVKSIGTLNGRQSFRRIRHGQAKPTAGSRALTVVCWARRQWRPSSTAS
ncbi:hypothetical protein [Xanthomonas campestris]|uniref:Uncharacterized protein n=1 Tax=Xanthomonas campestris pv. papavericola TaxID=487881 RepID=A0AAJ2X283_XANCA|nr:hypothetical protein [Xanthomonas campestris]MEC3887488.1 hypothetical protein [Xanthomonas campestris pv. papavericola]